MYAIARDMRHEASRLAFGRMAFITCMAIMAFQVGHAAEHIIQFGVWLGGRLGFDWITATFCGPDVPYISNWAGRLVWGVGAGLFPDAPLARQIMLGVEFLHLGGNLVFLVGIACAWYITRSGWVLAAFMVEGAHLIEHALLTWTAYYYGTPLGLSTLWGHALSFWGSRQGAVGYRVSWHFVMNLVPPMIILMGAIKWHEQRPVQHAR